LTISWARTTTDQTVSEELDRVTVDEDEMSEEGEVSLRAKGTSRELVLIINFRAQVVTEVVDQDEAGSTLV
jgi:hypothetical protein